MVLLHRLQEGRLRLGSGAIDLVRQHDVGEYRAFLELEAPAAVGCLQHNVGADQVGWHQVRSELNARELDIESVRDGADQQRLAQARYAFEEHMPAGDQRGERALDNFVLADKDLRDFLAKTLEVFTEFIQQGFGGFSANGGKLLGERPK